MRKFPPLSLEEIEELKKMRKEAGVAIPKIAEYMHTYPSRISELENGKKGADPNF